MSIYLKINALYKKFKSTKTSLIFNVFYTTVQYYSVILVKLIDNKQSIMHKFKKQ